MAETVEITDAMRRQLDALERTLERQTAVHEELLELLERKRHALRTAADREMTQLCVLENEKLRAIGELEKQRLTHVAELTRMLDPQAPAPLRLGELAERCPEPTRGRLLVLRQQLRQRITQVHEQASTARRATDALARHMQGVVQTIGMIATGVSTYNGSGALPAKATAVSTINMTA